MCIRDRDLRAIAADGAAGRWEERVGGEDQPVAGANEDALPCLLYTSDAADERSSVDLGGRRIIKKKTKSSEERNDYDIKTSQRQSIVQEDR